MTTRILVVEDNKDEHDFLHQLIQMRYPDGEVELVTVMTGEEAAMRVAESWDGMMIDLALPGMSGEELLKKMNPWPRFQGIPIILVTALHGTYWGETRVTDAWVESIAPKLNVRLMGKPYELDDFIAMVKEAMARKKPS